MLNWALSFCNKPSIEEWMYPNFIDTLVLSKLTFGVTGEEKINLGAACELAKIKLTDAHGAMNDVEATADLFRFYMKKLRSKKGDISVDENKSRPKGREFFEFKCANKN
jgi:DNA polymerase III alpha subunit (gram-positive type)